MAFNDAFDDVASATETATARWPHAKNRPPRRIFLYRAGGKRVLDILLALLMLPALLPMIAVIWLILRSDGGSALFRQTRVGRHGKVFTCYKFRTMVVDAEAVLARMCAADPRVAQEWQTHQKLRNDPRITRIGCILRKTSFDELPQIFNVLRGDMSLVGPRPFLPSQRETYEAAGGKSYYRLRPGVTGMWQVIGRHDTTFANRVRFDETYGNGYSLPGDLSLILRTAGVVVLRKGA